MADPTTDNSIPTPPDPNGGDVPAGTATTTDSKKQPGDVPIEAGFPGQTTVVRDGQAVTVKDGAPSPATGAFNTDGYAAPEGKTAIIDNLWREQAGIWATSKNPGEGVRMAMDLAKKIQGSEQNLTIHDAAHVWENAVYPEISAVKDAGAIRKVNEDYDSRGQKLLDQIYAPLAHGDTRPQWNQIPKPERTAAAAYAIVSLLRGKGVQALQGLSRPLTLQEQENVKQEQQAQQNEELRRQGLVEQWKVLMGDKTAEVSAIEQRQRQDALDSRQDSRLRDEDKRQQDRQTEENTRAAQGRWSTALRSGADSGQKKAALADYESEMRQITGNKNWKAPKEDYDAANTKTTIELAREAKNLAAKQRYDYNVKMAKPKLDLAMANAANALKRGKLDDAQLTRVNYMNTHILPQVADEDRERAAKLTLDVEQMQNLKAHGWVKNTVVKDGTLLRDANGNMVLDSGGTPIKTYGEARSKVADMDTLANHQAKALKDDLGATDIPPEMWNSIHSIIADDVRQGRKPEEIEKYIGTVLAPGKATGAPAVDPTLISRAIAIEQMKYQTDKLREKLGSAHQEPAHQGQPSSSGSNPPAHPKSGDTWDHPSGAKMVFGNGPKGLGWYNSDNYSPKGG